LINNVLIVPGTGLTCGHPETPARGVTKTCAPASPWLVFHFVRLGE